MARAFATLLVQLQLLGLLLLAHLLEAGAPPKYRVDCDPARATGGDEALCRARGCQWAAASLPHQPVCFYASEAACYQVERAQQVDSGAEECAAVEQRWLLTRRPECPQTGFRNEARQLELRVIRRSESVINVKLSEPNRWHHEPRLPEISLPGKRARCNQPNDFHVELSEDARQLVIRHSKTRTLLLELELAKLIYSERFIQLTSYLPSAFLYGLGAHMGPSLLKSNTSEYSSSYTMFNYGHPPQTDGRSSYSSYPFYINLVKLQNRQPERDPQFMALGGFMHNSNAMDVLHHNRKAEEDFESALTWRPVGGLIDLYLFAGPHPHQVLHQYMQLVGEPALPPAWALGFHLSRLNYREPIVVKLAWARNRDIGIPIETLWTDLDFMWRRTSYAVDEPKLVEFIQVLHDQFDMHYVPIVDSAISMYEDPQKYVALKLAMSMELFASYTNQSGHSQVALVKQWTDSQHAGVLDFTSPHIVAYLTYVLDHYRQQLPFDGLWLDMNEPEVFHNYAADEQAGDECSADEQLAYLPGGRKLSDKTLCMSAQFHAGTHFDLHNLFAFYQTKAHHEALLHNHPNRRPFLVSRAQYPGQGRYGGAWLGDMGSSFEYLRWSLLGTIESNWFGQPLVGADICGFFGAADDDLCARWFSLGAFYPFARSHNGDTLSDQDPASMGPMVQRAARTALTKRYSLLPYLYTLFHLNHLYARPVITSVLFEFIDKLWRLPWPLDDLRLSDLPQIDDQLMLGPALMLAPIVNASQTSRKVYLAPGRWYDVSLGLPGTQMDEMSSAELDFLQANRPLVEAAGNLSEDEQRRWQGLLEPYDCTLPLGCRLLDVYSPLGSTNLYMRGGTIVPSFRFVDSKRSVGQHWAQPIFLDVALDERGEAFGKLYLDNGESDPAAHSYNHVDLYATKNRLEISLLENNYRERAPLFQGFQVFGVQNVSEPAVASLQNGAKLEFSHDTARRTLSCVFLKPEGVEQRELLPVALVKQKTLIFRW